MPTLVVKALLGLMCSVLGFAVANDFHSDLSHHSSTGTVSDRCCTGCGELSHTPRDHFLHPRTDKANFTNFLREGLELDPPFQDGKLSPVKNKSLSEARMTLDLSFPLGSVRHRQGRCQKSSHPSFGKFSGKWDFLAGDSRFTWRIKNQIALPTKVFFEALHM